jgi:hypothetical protein
MRRALLLLLLVVPAWVPLACGGDEGDGGRSSGDRNRLVSALQKAQGSPATGRLTMRADTDRDGRVEVRGLFATDGERSRLRARYELDAGALDMELLRHGEVAYVRTSRIAPALPPGKRWVRTSDPSQLGNSPMSPDMFRSLLEASGGVEDLGREEVRGADAVHLRATVDMRRVPASEITEETEAFVGGLGDENADLPIDVWIGPDGRPLRYRVEMEQPREGGGEPQFVELVYDVLAYEARLDLNAPPARQVVPASALG